MYKVHVFKADVDLYTPSDSMQPMMPDKEQLQLAALCAARESWLQALCAAGLASHARQDAALAQASRQVLLQDLHSAGSAVMLRLYQHAARVAAEYAAKVAAKQAAACAAAAQAAHAELVLMCSVAQSEATALNEAEIAYLTTKVQSLAAGMAHFHANRCVWLLLR